MPVKWQQIYADRTERMRASDIREILKVTAQPDVISLAGGLPAPELFPIDEFRRAREDIDADFYNSLTYFELWAEGFVNLMQEKGVLTRSEVESRMAALKARQ